MVKDELSKETEKIVRVNRNNKGWISQIRLFVFIVHIKERNLLKIDLEKYIVYVVMQVFLSSLLHAEKYLSSLRKDAAKLLEISLFLHEYFHHIPKG